MYRFTALLCALFPLITSAQAIEIKGIVIDEAANEPLPFAQVAIYSNADQEGPALEGTTSDDNGHFSLNIKPEEGLELRVVFIGYATEAVPLDMNTAGKQLNVGRIFMQIAAGEIEGVEIEGRRSFMTTNLDKRVFDVRQNIVSEGGTAEEALQNIPSVSVDMDGGVSLRGSNNVTIWINGKPSALIGGDRNAFLDQLPASEIDRIEVITNPSSKYDADGTGGIINIILKKDRKAGTNGSFTSAVGTRNKTNQNLLLNHRQGKLTLGLSYSFNYREVFLERESERTNFLPNNTFTNSQDFFAKSIDRNHVGRFTADYELENGHSIGVSAGGGVSNRHQFERDDYLFTDVNDDPFNEFTRRGENYRLRNTYEFDLSHRKDFSEKGREWTSSFSYSYSDQNEDQFIRQIQDAVYRPGSESDSLYQENFLNMNQNTFLTVQTDYVHPLSENSLFETGAKTIVRTIETGLERQIERNGDFVKDDRVSNEFRFTEAVHAAYINYQNKWGNLRFQGGLRGEMAMTESEQLTLDTAYPYNYANLFPSAFISYDIGKGSKLQASYTRRINRPSFRTLNPFVDVTDPLNFRRGNPTLIPEFYDSYEIGVEKMTDVHTITGSVYYRGTNNQITRFRRLLDPNEPLANGDDGITITSFENLVTARSVGVEGVYILNLGRKLNAQTSFNYFYRTLEGENIQADLNNEGQSWNARGNMNWSPTDRFSFQLSFFYWGPGPTPQGRRLAIYGMDAGAKYDFWNKKASISLRVSDVFNTRRFRLEIEDPAFVNQFMFNRETQIGFLSFTYRFGSHDREDRRKRRGERRGGSDVDEGFDM